MAVIYLERRLRQLAVHKRKTFELYSNTAQADVAVSLSSSSTFYTSAILDGFANGTGTVTLTGLLSGATVSHVHTFGGNHRVQNTTQEFDSISRIQTANLIDESVVGTVTIEATSRTGQPKETEFTIGNKKCRVISARLGEIIQVTGGTEMHSAKIHLYPRAGVLRNDTLTVDGKTWSVKAMKHMYDQRGTRAYDEAVVFAEGQA